MRKRMIILLHLAVCFVIIVLSLSISCSRTAPNTVTKPETKPELTLEDATALFDFRDELPGFTYTPGGSPWERDTLGTSSQDILYINKPGKLYDPDYCQIDCVFWIVDETVAEHISAVDSGIVKTDPETETMQSVDLGASVDAVLYETIRSKAVNILDSLIFKYGRVFVLINLANLSPCHEAEHISLVNLGIIVVQRLKEYSQ